MVRHAVMLECLPANYKESMAVYVHALTVPQTNAYKQFLAAFLPSSRRLKLSWRHLNDHHGWSVRSMQHASRWSASISPSAGPRGGHWVCWMIRDKSSMENGRCAHSRAEQKARICPKNYGIHSKQWHRNWLGGKICMSGWDDEQSESWLTRCWYRSEIDWI